MFAVKLPPPPPHKRQNEQKTLLYVFVLISCVLFFIFMTGLINDPSGPQRNIFFLGMEDLFADFFNVLRYISDRDPYFNEINGLGQKIYLPLTYLILYPFSHLDDFATMTLPEIWNSKIAIMFALLYILFSVFFLVLSLNKLRKKYKISSIVILGLLLSHIFLFALERTNIIIITSALIAFFLALYDSEYPRERILGVICLAAAAALKIYPALFGVLYFERKQFKEIGLSVIIALALTFVPFLFFKRGFSNIPQLITNLTTFNAGSSSNLPDSIFGYMSFLASKVFNIDENVDERASYLIGNIADVINNIAIFISILFACLIKDKWIKTSLLVMVILFIPIEFGYYTGLFLFPVIILYFGTTENRTWVFNIYVLLVFVAYLNPFQIAVVIRNKNWMLNYYIGNSSLLSLWFILLILSGKQIITDCLSKLYVKKMS